MNKNKNFRDKWQCEPCISSTTIADDDKSVASHNSTFFKGLTGLPSITTSMQHTTFIRTEILAKGGGVVQDSAQSTGVDDHDPVCGLTCNLFLKIWTFIVASQPTLGFSRRLPVPFKPSTADSSYHVLDFVLEYFMTGFGYKSPEASKVF